MPPRPNAVLSAIALSAVILLSPIAAMAGKFKLQTIPLPDQFNEFGVNGLNDKDQLVGTARDGDDPPQGYVWVKGVTTVVPTVSGFVGVNDRGIALAAPDGVISSYNTYDINSGKLFTHKIKSRGDITFVGFNDAGTIAGYSIHHIGGHEKNFILSARKPVRIVPPGAAYSFLGGLNDSGTIVGTYSDQAKHGTLHSFSYNAGSYSEFDPPGYDSSEAVFVTDAGVIGILGQLKNAAVGILKSGDNYTTISVKDGAATYISGVGPTGEVVGTWQKREGHPPFSGFVLVNSKYYILNIPGAIYTRVSGVNANGTVFGIYTGTNGFNYPWIATCAKDQFPCTEFDSK